MIWPPGAPSRPYITIGMTQERDWSTSTEEGCEHVVTLHCWTENNGRRQLADEILQLRLKRLWPAPRYP